MLERTAIAHRLYMPRGQTQHLLYLATHERKVSSFHAQMCLTVPATLSTRTHHMACAPLFSGLVQVRPVTRFAPSTLCELWVRGM